MDQDLKFIKSVDSGGNPLEGGRNYHFHLPSDMPAANFWSVVVYDIQNQLIIKSEQPWPSVHSNCKNLVVSQDGSVDIFFGPQAPADKECNWLQTLPGNGWYLILRLYEPLESWFTKTWKCGEIEEEKQI